MRTKLEAAPEEIEAGVAAAQRPGIAANAHRSSLASGREDQTGATVGYLRDGRAGGTVDGSGCDL